MIKLKTYESDDRDFDMGSVDFLDYDFFSYIGTDDYEDAPNGWRLPDPSLCHGKMFILRNDSPSNKFNKIRSHDDSSVLRSSYPKNITSNRYFDSGDCFIVISNGTFWSFLGWYMAPL